MSHHISECVHGIIVSQCRCPGPKDVVIVPCPDGCIRKDEYVGKHRKTV